ncbi:hypothetical protein [Chryseobacterium sp.]|uniref:hypothetical protein n=1 Tax=Chryseobacterium sp. TaxID=1871047 RepID=UPI002FC94061
MPEVSQKQIDAWKAEHGDVFCFKLGANKDKICYLKAPDRKTISFAGTAGATDHIRYNEIMLEACWLAGDEEIKTNNGLFFSISQHIPSLVEITEVEMVKL